ELLHHLTAGQLSCAEAVGHLEETALHSGELAGKPEDALGAAEDRVRGVERVIEPVLFVGGLVDVAEAEEAVQRAQAFGRAVGRAEGALAGTGRRDLAVQDVPAALRVTERAGCGANGLRALPQILGAAEKAAETRHAALGEIGDAAAPAAEDILAGAE